MTDVDPPSYDARRATSWLVLFMTHVASCGAGAVIKSSQEPGQSYIDYTDPEFRQKLATRLGMARHRADVEAIQATREAARTAEAEADRDGSGDDSGGSGSGSSDDDEEAEYNKYNGANFRVDDHNTKRFEKACDDYKSASIRTAGMLRTACTAPDGAIQHNVQLAWQMNGISLADTDGAKMLRVLVEHISARNGKILHDDWSEFRQGDDDLAAYLSRFLSFVQLFAFMGLTMTENRKKRSFIEKLAPEHRPAVVNAVSFASALATMQKIVQLDEHDDITRQREDESARRAVARRARERGTGNGGGGGGGGGFGAESDFVFTGHCHDCGEKGHKAADCPRKAAKKKSDRNRKRRQAAKARKAKAAEDAPAAELPSSGEGSARRSADVHPGDGSDDEMVHLPADPFVARRTLRDDARMSDRDILDEEDSFGNNDMRPARRLHVSMSTVAATVFVLLALFVKMAVGSSALLPWVVGMCLPGTMCRDFANAAASTVVIDANLTSMSHDLAQYSSTSQEVLEHCTETTSLPHDPASGYPWSAHMVPQRRSDVDLGFHAGFGVNCQWLATIIEHGAVTALEAHGAHVWPARVAIAPGACSHRVSQNHAHAGYNPSCSVADTRNNRTVWWHQTPGFGIPFAEFDGGQGNSMRVVNRHEREFVERPWMSWTSELGGCHAAAGMFVTITIPVVACSTCTVGPRSGIYCRRFFPRVVSYAGPAHRRKPSSLPSKKAWRRRVNAGSTNKCSEALCSERAVARPAKCSVGRGFNPRNPRSLPSCLDSGSTHHVGNDRRCFGDDYKEVRGRSIGTATAGRSSPIVGVGTMYIDAVDAITGKPCVLELPGALHVPDFEQSLISTPCLEAAGHRVVHDSKDPNAGITIRDADGRDVVHIRTHYDGRQYVLHGSPNTGAVIPAARRSLHSVLAHCNDADAKATVERSTGLDDAKVGDVKSCQCNVCIAAKITESPHGKEPATPVCLPGQQIHVDICVMPTKSFSGARYNLTATDAATRFKWEFALKSRSDAGAVVPDLADEIRELLPPEHKVKVTVRSDNELAQGSFERAAKKQGWNIESTSPGSSFQNGKGERPFRTIVASVRAMLIEAKLGPAFWELAYTHAVFVENRIARGGKPSSYEQCFGKQPDFTNVHKFGELVACWIHPAHRDKLESRCNWGFYVGKSQSHPADCITVFLPQTKRSVNTRNFVVVPRPPGDQSPGIQRWRFAPSTHGTPQCPDNSLPVADSTVDTAAGSSTAAPASPDEIVGRSVRKHFPGHGWFIGKITGTKHGGSIVKVQYNDGDEEELDFEEAVLLLVPQGKTSGGVARRPAGGDSEKIDPVGEATKFKCTPSEGMTVYRTAKWLNCDPTAYLEFVRGFQLRGYQRITLRSKFRKGTHVPVPDEEYQRILSHATRARVAVSLDEPGGLTPTFKQTQQRRDAPAWVDARRKQFDDLQNCPPRPTLTIMDRSDAPRDIFISQTSWVNVVKLLPCGGVDRAKSRLVGRGDMECAYRDYDPMGVSAMPVRFSSVLMCFAVASQLGLHATSVDFSAAYTNAPMRKETWIHVPEGIPGVPRFGKDGKIRVARVNNSLFGFKTSGAAWAELLDTKLRSIGGLKPVSPDAAAVSGAPVPGVTVHPCKSDPNVYRYDRGGEVCIVCAYSDDCLLFSSCPKLRQDIVDSLKEFQLRDEGDATAFLGMQIEKQVTESGKLSYKLSMPGFIKRLLENNQMHEANPVSRPASSAEKITDAGIRCDNADQVRKCIGGLLWAAVTVRPDILSATNALCRHMHCPTPMTAAGAKRVCRYLRGTIGRGINFSCENPSLDNQKTLAFTAYSDADWGDDVDTGRSTSGHVLMMSGAAFANRSRLEKPVAMSSCESEAMAMCGCVQEIDFYRDFLNELKLGNSNAATTLYVDNRSAVLDAHNTTGRRTRHINLRFHRVRQSVREKTVKILHVRGGVSIDSMQVADVHTKPTNTALFRKFSANILGEVAIDCKMLPRRNG